MATRPTIVYCWGNTANGQLGLGGIEDDQITTARHLAYLDDKPVKDIACGVDHTLFLVNGGVAYSCGNNDHGQLGHDKTRRRPETIDVLETQIIKAVACGAAHSIAVNDRGQLLTWGENKYFQLGRQTASGSTANPPKVVRDLGQLNVIQVACGFYHTLALTDDGQLFSWGYNSNGQLGIGANDATAHSESPSCINCVSSLRGVGISYIAAGSRHSVALTVSGALFAWGCNKYGQLGVGDETDRSLPTLVRTLRSHRVRYVACGEDHTVALTQDGGVFTFGAGMYGQLGHANLNSETLPRKVFELMGSSVSMVACGRRHTIAYVPANGRLYAFGLGGNGQLGIDSKVNRPQPSPVVGLESVAIVSVYCGGDQSFVLACSKSKNNDKQSVVSQDFRVRPPHTQIATLTKETVYNFQKMCGVQKPSAELQSQIEKVFSSSSCLNASFLSQGDTHYFCNSKNHGVAIADAEEIFNVIGELKNEYIKQIIAGVLERELIPTLTESSPPDVEALRIFLTLPYLHFFCDPEFYITIICPFTHALLHTLDKNASRVLESWWCLLGSSYLLRLVRIYKRVLLFILNEPTATTPMQMLHRRRGLYTCMEMLKKLSAVNQSSVSTRSGVQLIPYEEFYVPELKDKVDLRKDFVRFSGCRLAIEDDSDMDKLPMGPDGSPHLYCSYPFLFDGQAKTLLLQVDARIQMQMAMEEVARRNFASLFLPIDPANPFLLLQVSRQNIVQDTIDQLTKHPMVDLKKPLKVIFSGEEAMDAGGVKKEFFLLLLKEVLDPKYGMFTYYPESKLIWFNPESFETPDMYVLIGVLCGLAIYNLTIIDISLPLALYRKLLKRKATLDDLRELQPAIGRSMQQMLDYEGEDFQDVFGIAFEVTREVYGEVKTIELIPGGSFTNVSQQNKQEFADVYVDYIFNQSVKEQFEAFSQGFHRVCGGRVLDLFQPQELQAMVVGNENYDWDELEKNTEYKNGYDPEHPTIRMFWSVFHRDLSLEDKKKFLLFLTGSDRIPILGMKAVKLFIQPTKVDDRYLPVAHTCFNLLDLPMYSHPEIMRRKLLQAIEHTHGFALV